MAPLPRYRLYDDPRTYLTIGRELASGRWKTGARAPSSRSRSPRSARRTPSLTPRARVAIHLAVKGLIRPGQKVVLSPYTIADVVNMVVAAGGVPVFADIERETCNVDPAEIEKLVDADTGAVMVTHLHGLACDMDVIPRICAERGVALIEDAAQAFGARYAGRPVGSFGDAAVFSFGKYKNVNAFLGGVLLTRHAELAEQARARWPPPLQDPRATSRRSGHGLATDVATWPPLFRAFTFWVLRFAFLQEFAILNRQVSFDNDPELRRELPEPYQRRMTPLQARLVLRQLARVDGHTRERVERARAYHEGLRELSEVMVAPLRTDFSHMYTEFPIQVDDRNALLRHLMRRGRDVAGQHIKNCADFPAFSAWQRDCPNARKTAGAVVLLPTYPRYSMRDVEANVRVIREYFGAAVMRVAVVGWASSVAAASALFERVMRGGARRRADVPLPLEALAADNALRGVAAGARTTRCTTARRRRALARSPPWARCSARRGNALAEAHPRLDLRVGRRRRGDPRRERGSDAFAREGQPLARVGRRQLSWRTNDFAGWPSGARSWRRTPARRLAARLDLSKDAIELGRTRCSARARARSRNPARRSSACWRAGARATRSWSRRASRWAARASLYAATADALRALLLRLRLRRDLERRHPLDGLAVRYRPGCFVQSFRRRRAAAVHGREGDGRSTNATTR